jgi:hypothetical protein
MIRDGMRAVLLLSIVLPLAAIGQCFGGEQWPANTVVPDPTGTPTTISTASWAGDRALVSLIAGRTYRFTSSVTADHITISTDVSTGALVFGTQPVSFTATSSQTYYVHFHLNNSCGTEQISRTTQVTTIYCPAGSGSCGGADEAILQVNIGNINNNSGGCGNGGYSDFSSMNSVIYTGASTPITVVNQNPYAGDQVSVWVDWDRNMVFDNTLESFVLGTGDNITFTGDLIPPAGVIDGPVQMRVRLTYTGQVEACGTSTYGEVEDYTLTVAPLIVANGGIYDGGDGRGDASTGYTNAAIPSSIYAGGNGRGDVSIAFSSAPITSAIFSGGDGRGDVMAGFTSAPIASSIYTGGNGRGDVMAGFTSIPIASAIYTGGNGRGDVMAGFTSAPIASSIYTGGNGRGDVMAGFTSAPTVSSIYTGGNGRGDVMAGFTSAPIASSIYTGGNGRGDVMAGFTSAPIASSIYTGGNGRGDVMAGFTSAPIASSIYAGGNGRGDVMMAFSNTPIFSSIYRGGIGRGDVSVSIDPQQPSALLLTMRGFLDGAYVAASGTMRDDLRSLGHVPLAQPYSMAPFSYSGTETILPAVLSLAGNDAIVDWVLLELRDASNPATVVVRRAALIQRDGDIVDVEGTGAVRFTNVPPGNYHLAISHRNHHGVMTAASYALNGQPSPLVDLSSGSVATYGTNARRNQGGTMTLWGGNANSNLLVSYSGSNNDRTNILNTLGAGTFLSPLAGYHNADVNMNGVVSYSGSNNDRTFVLNTLGATTFLVPIVVQMP